MNFREKVGDGPQGKLFIEKGTDSRGTRKKLLNAKTFQRMHKELEKKCRCVHINGRKAKEVEMLGWSRVREKGLGGKKKAKEANFSSTLRGRRKGLESTKMGGKNAVWGTGTPLGASKSSEIVRNQHVGVARSSWGAKIKKRKYSVLTVVSAEVVLHTNPTTTSTAG